MLSKIQSLKGNLLYQNPRVRKIYNFALSSIKTYKSEGFDLFLHQIRSRTFERYVDTSKISLFETKLNHSATLLSLIKPLEGSFTYPAENLNKINIFTIIPRGEKSSLKLQLMDENKELIREKKIKGSKIKKNEYTSFEFKPIKESKDKLFYFKLSSNSATLIKDNSKSEFSISVLYEERIDLKDCKGKQNTNNLTVNNLFYSRLTANNLSTLVYEGKNLSGNIGLQAFSKLGIQHEYNLWMLKNKITALKIEEYKEELQNFVYKPKISIVMPVYNVDQIWLEKALDSVRNQIYTNWELCIADDASTKPHIKSTLTEYSKKDPRIKVKYLIKNLGISGASNEALSLATGEFIGLLDNDDELSIDALYEIVKKLNDKPETDFIYSDEDKIDMEGRRSKPFFKPGWSPDLLLSVNYICHFSVIRKKLVEDVGKFRLGYEGSQDYDLFLRVTEKTVNIEHIPKILYYWRMIPGSTASNINAKDKASINGIKALQDYLKRQKIEGTVSEGLNRTNYQVDYTIKGDPLVSILVDCSDNLDNIKQCINSIIKNTEKIRYEILLLVPHGNAGKLFLNLDLIKKQIKVKSSEPNFEIIEYNPSLNVFAVKNSVAEKANGDYLLFLDKKIEIIAKNWLSRLLMYAQRKEIGCVGPKLINYDGTARYAGIVFGSNLDICNVFSGLPENSWTNFGLNTWSRNFLAFNGECLLIYKNKFFQVDGFDKNLQDNLAYVDLCLKIHEKGYRNFLVADVFLYLSKIRLREQEVSFNELQKMLNSYKTLLETGDPYYNPNLSLETNGCNLILLY